jgi:protein-arginine kinase activator protein McsA
MKCQQCFQRPALERDGRPAFLSLFGTVEGYFCEECAREIQRPYEEELRRSVAERAPQLTDEDLAGLPDQMLKFTVTLPIRSSGSGIF